MELLVITLWSLPLLEKQLKLLKNTKKYIKIHMNTTCENDSVLS